MIDKDKLYPLLFDPVYMSRMWGGSMMSKTLDRILPETDEPIGESWELTDRYDAVSCVSNGELKGAKLNELVGHYGRDLIGSKYQSGPFPLLVKIIDAGKRLSLQVHPDEAACAAIGEGAEPKTEMWYIIAAEKGAKIMAGLKAHATKMQFLDTMHGSEVEGCLQIFDSSPGDAFFIKSGRLHAIGAGNLLLEIQQNSDTTYRVSDWGRVDSNGNSRELHVEKALKSIDFMDRTPPIIRGVSDSVEHNRKFPIVNKCPFFQVQDLRLVEKWLDNTRNSDSFNLITAINNPVIVGRDDLTTRVEKGATCLIPACFGSYSIALENSEPTTVVKTTL
jgi:mannose-6-phosphate isomerase